MKTDAWVIAKAARGHYDPSCLRWEPRELPPLADGQVLVQTLFLSLDPTSRNWLKLEPHSTFLPLKVGDVMIGAAIGRVVQSRSPGFAPGMLVQGMWGWAGQSVADPRFLEPIEPQAGVPLEAHMTIFSHIGRAAAIGLFAVGGLKPSDTVVVSGAAGATGSLAVQIAKAYGRRVVGVAGGPDKCRRVVEDFGADAAIDYRAGNLAEALARTCPDGVDLFFDNVGGEILDAVLDHMALGCRIAICGAVSQYDLADPADAYGVRNLPLLMFRRARMEGFVVPQFADRYAEFDAILRSLFLAGRLRNRPHVIEGLEGAPEALKLIFNGGNDGKLMVRVAAP